MRRILLLSISGTLAVALSPCAARGDTFASASGWCAVAAYRALAAGDQVPVRIETTGNPDGSKTSTFGCGSSDFFRFGAGLSQNFGASAWVGGYGYAGEGVLRAFLRVGAQVSPKRYGVGAVGDNPYVAKASGSTTASFTDVLVVPPTAGAPNPGDATTISLVARLTCVETGLYQVQWFTDSTVGASVSDAAGNYIDGVTFNTNLSYGRATCQPLSNDMFPKTIATTVGASLTMTAGIGLTLSTLHGTNSGIADLDAYTDATGTGTFAVRAADGTPLVGASGTVYDGTTGSVPPLVSPTSTTTTTTATTSTTLAGCETTCGNGTVEPACGETCDCPATVDPIAAAYGCSGDTVLPAQPGCAVCRGCRLDTHICDAQAVTTTTTIPGGASTTTTLGGGATTTSTTTTVPGGASTTTLVGGATTTSTTLARGDACRDLPGLARARCRIDAALVAPFCDADPVPAKLDRGLRARLRSAASRLAAADAAEGKKRARLLKKARTALDGAGRSAAAATRAKRSAKRISPACGSAIGGLVAAVEADL